MEEKELDLHEQIAVANENFKETYHDLIYALAEKYRVDVGIGCDMAKAIARAEILGEIPQYNANVEYNLDELVADYKVILDLSNKIANN